MTLLLRCPMATALAALSALLLIAALACGPVAQENLPTPAAIQQPAPLSDSGAAAETSASTETPAALPPKPTPLPTLPPKPTETLLPTPLPTLDLRTPAPTLAPDTPHPDGLAGCLEMSIFVATPTEYSDYIDWCSEQIIAHVVTTCRGSGDSEAELACANQTLENARQYYIRVGFIRCFAITNEVASEECAIESGDLFNNHIYNLWDVWAKVHAAANRDQAVVTVQKDVIACLEALGHEKIEVSQLFRWQLYNDPAELQQRDAGYTPEQKADRAALAEPTDQCARQTGYYAAQDAAWTAEVERLYQEEPETAAPLRNEGILEILKGHEIAPFLTLRK